MLDRRGFFASVMAGAALAAVPAVAVVATPIDARLRERAMSAFARHRGRVRFTDVIGVADYSQPSREKRFHLVNVGSGAVTSLLVAHGRGSDPQHTGWLTRFSNDDGSNASCAGAFVTDNEYVGKHGRSMRLTGLEPSNCNAMERAIVVHAAPYVNAAMARDLGKVGRSLGCFTVTEADLDQVLTRLGPGHFLYSDKV